MYVLFGPYGCRFDSLDLCSNVFEVTKKSHQATYKMGVEMIARNYVDANATLPTINAFFLRPILRAGFNDLFKEILSLNIQALLAALANRSYKKIALCLGPQHDCYTPELAPTTESALEFHKNQYELCLEVLDECSLPTKDIIFLHETIGAGREALGLSLAAKELNIPLIISFVVKQNGSLLSGKNIQTVIENIDLQTNSFATGYALNCCSPYAFEKTINTFTNQATIKRILGFYPNSYDADPSMFESGKTLPEPNKQETLQMIVAIGKKYNLQFIGGCCGFSSDDTKLLAEMVAKKF